MKLEKPAAHLRLASDVRMRGRGFKSGASSFCGSDRDASRDGRRLRGLFASVNQVVNHCQNELHIPRPVGNSVQNLCLAWAQYIGVGSRLPKRPSSSKIIVHFTAENVVTS